jgi:parafibromin
VPSSATPGNICLANSKGFLQDGQYAIATSSKPASGDQSKVLVERRIGDQTVTFEVHESVTSFTEREWRRVVAVFVNGQTWQFKDWSEFMNGSLSKYVELFLRVRGYYLHFQDIAVPEQITKWNVKTLTLQRNKRHQDRTIYNELWADFEVFLKREKFGGLGKY